MNVQLKELGARIHPRKWSGMTWAVVMMVVACSIATAIAGVKLVQLAERQAVVFDTK